MNDQTLEVLFILCGMTWVGIFLVAYVAYRIYRWWSETEVD